ncbi:fatty-acid-binding protein 1-like [Cucurbita pepo subsp. pepo]|uniref:fatty-acid-binding protein 1-like n=1 Tax=Cucurbita pepo subsp. pepo TaxID=3664 RepID=UPI000C9D73B0|nr:fatty-acid-binding protein 1-like [Cucurbita pepo subsp. pepo]
MASLRFPFSFPQPPKPPRHSFPRPSYAVAASAAVGAAATIGFVAATRNSMNLLTPFLESTLNSSPLLASLSLADNSTAHSVVDPRTGLSFPSVIRDSQQLLGIGLRKKAVLGLKNITVYAFGVYADSDDLKESLSEKYGKLTVSELQEKDFEKDVMEGDIRMTVRLQIDYEKLRVGFVRNAFEESIGTRLQKFGGSNSKALLRKFTSQFKDEYKVCRGSVIDLSKERGHVLRTMVDGKEVGSIQSQILCRAILDLYIGEDPFDRQAKEDIRRALFTTLQKELKKKAK